MAEGWSFLLSESASKPKRNRRGIAPLIVICLALGLGGALLYFLLSGSNGGDAAGGQDGSPQLSDQASEPPGTVGTVGPVVPKAPPGVQINTYGDRTDRLAGLEFLEKGEIDEAERWFRNYLTTPPDGRDDQALLALGLIHKHRGRKIEAEDAFRRLFTTRSDSLLAGDGIYELVLLLEGTDRQHEGSKLLLEAVRIYPRSNGGRRAARKLGDELYEQHVVTKKRRLEWERIRDLYSIALPGVTEPEERRALIERLDQLNEWIIFTAYARPAEGYPTNIVFHTVRRGDTIGLVAKRYGVTQGSIRRINGISPDSNIIKPGEELKILRGKTVISVDMNKLTMTVLINGSFFREYNIGVGREGRTPPGTFKIASRIIDPDWWYKNEVYPPGHPKNILGTRWLGFEKKGPGRGIGLHGSVLVDGQYNGIGKRESNGCVRMCNPDVEELFDFAPINTEVAIVE